MALSKTYEAIDEQNSRSHLQLSGDSQGRK